MQKQLAAAVALLCLGVACVSMAALSYSDRTSLLQAPMMVIDIPVSQGLLMGEECQKACDDNFMKCTHDVSINSSLACSSHRRHFGVTVDWACACARTRSTRIFRCCRCSDRR